MGRRKPRLSRARGLVGRGRRGTRLERGTRLVIQNFCNCKSHSEPTYAIKPKQSQLSESSTSLLYKPRFKIKSSRHFTYSSIFLLITAWGSAALLLLLYHIIRVWSSYQCGVRVATDGVSMSISVLYPYLGLLRVRRWSIRVVSVCDIN